jgi:CBS domain-containing protein
MVSAPFGAAAPQGDNERLASDPLPLRRYPDHGDPATVIHLGSFPTASEAEMRVKDIMTPNPACCTADAPAQEAARLMRDHDCGAIPVVEDGGRLVAMVTDRDLTVRLTAEGKGPDTPVREAMTERPTTAVPEDEVETVREVMIREKVRRVPVVDENGRCVGIVAQADIALEDGAASDREVGRIVEAISEPDRGDLPATG